MFWPSFDLFQLRNVLQKWMLNCWSGRKSVCKCFPRNKFLFYLFSEETKEKKIFFTKIIQNKESTLSIIEQEKWREGEGGGNINLLTTIRFLKCSFKQEASTAMEKHRTGTRRYKRVLYTSESDEGVLSKIAPCNK